MYHRPPVPDHKQPPVVNITTKYYNLLIALDQGFVLGFIFLTLNLGKCLPCTFQT